MTFSSWTWLRAIDLMKQAGIDRVGLITAKLEAGQ